MATPLMDGPDSLAARRRSAVWTGSGVALLVLAARLHFIAGYGSDLPYWDQWDAEGAHLLIPFLEGKLQWTDLFAPHNEHRIVLSRLLSLSLLIVAGQWDALLQVVVNAMVHAGAIGFFAGFACAHVTRVAGTVAAVGITAAFSLPLPWENILVGLQSQFHFLLLLSLLHIVGTASAHRKTFLWAAQLAGVASLLSMASGLTSAAAVILVVFARSLQTRRFGRSEAGLILFNACLVLAGWWLKVDHPGHDSLRAQSLDQFVSALTQFVQWPTTSAWLLPLVLLPFGLLLRQWWLQPTPFRLTLLGLSVWWSAQVVLLAYGRGAYGDPVAARYMDVLLLAVCVALVSWIDAWQSESSATPRRLMVALFVLWFAAMGQGFVARHQLMWDAVGRMLESAPRRREAVVRAYVQDGGREFFEREPWYELPYPDAERLALLLNNPHLRQVLPPSVRTSPPDTSAISTPGRLARALVSFRWGLALLGLAALAVGARPVDLRRL